MIIYNIIYNIIIKKSYKKLKMLQLLQNVENWKRNSLNTEKMY